MNNRTVYIASAIFAGILVFAGVVYFAFIGRWQLYLNMKATDDKQNEYILEHDKRLQAMEHKLVIFEQHMKTEAEAAQKQKTR